MVVLALGIGTTTTLFLLEGLVRFFYDQPVQPRFVIDSGFGIRANQPGVHTRHYVPGEYDVAINTNSCGMRGRREYPLERVAGKRRVVILGDSFAFGYGVNDDEVVSARLEDIFGQRVLGGAEVINLAVSGFGQAEEMITWQRKGKDYQPDFVVMFYFENDIGNNVVSKLYTLGHNGELMPTGLEFLPGSRLQERLLAFPPTRWLFEHSQAWNLLRTRLSSKVQREMLSEQGLSTFRDTTPEALELTRSLLMQFVRDARTSNALPIFVIIPDSRTLSSNFPMHADELASMDVSVVDGREFLTNNDYYPIDSHWRASGHSKAAERLASLIQALRP